MEKKNILAGVPGKILIYSYAAFLLAPMYFIVVTALKKGDEISKNPLGLPSEPAFGNFYEAFVKGEIAHNAFNSIVISSFTVILVVIINTLLAYGLYKTYSKKIGAFIYSAIIAGMMVAPVGYVTTILLYRQFHLYNKLLGVIVANVAGSVPFAMFILVGYLRSLPKDLEDAATIDGCTDFQNLFFVITPVIKPALATIGIFNMVSSWNNLLTPILLLKNEKLYTIPIGLVTFKGTYTVDYNLLFAAVFITAVPILILYLAFQKNFVESLSGSVKG